jgi:hypothetical protein
MRSDQVSSRGTQRHRGGAGAGHLLFTALIEAARLLMVRTRALVLTVMVLAAASSPLAAQDTAHVSAQFWPELNVYVHLNGEARLFFIATPSHEVEDGRRTETYDWQIGPFIEFGLRPLIPSRAARSRAEGSKMQYLRFRSGIEYQGLPGAGNEEYRLVEELTPLTLLPGDVLLYWRNRLELLIHPGRSMTLVPYTSAELFWDSRRDTFNRIRCQFGVMAPASSWLEPEVNYTYQQDKSDGPNLITHALNVVVAFRF